MNVDKSQILELLKSKGHDDQENAAKDELPDKIDTDNEDHEKLLSKFGLSPADLISKFGGNLPGGLGDKLGGML